MTNIFRNGGLNVKATVIYATMSNQRCILIHAINVDKLRKRYANFICASHNLIVERYRHYGIPREYRRFAFCEAS